MASKTALAVPEPVRAVPIVRRRREPASERRARETAEEREWWDRAERILAILTGTGGLPVILGAVGGAAAFYPYGIRVLTSSYDAFRNLWRVDIEATGFATKALSIDVAPGQAVGAHVGFPNLFTVYVPSHDASVEGQKAAESRAMNQIAAQLATWGVGVGAGLTVLAGSLGALGRGRTP